MTSDATTIRRGRFDVDGRQLFIECRGEGGPTVVLEAGMGMPGSSWGPIWDAVATFARVCRYDRAGIGQSDRGAHPASSQSIAEELHALLAAAGIAGPYVLVGHSFGGLSARMFASRYPHDMDGLVLVDATHEDLDARVLAALPAPAPGEPESLTAYRQAFSEQIIQEPEWIDWRATVEEMGASGTLGDIPLVVISAGRFELAPPDFPDDHVARLAQIWLDLQRAQLRLSSHSTQIVAQQSGHAIPRDQPELIVDAIRQVVTAARLDLDLGDRPQPERWTRCRPEDIPLDPERDRALSAWQRAGAPPLKIVIGGPFNAGKSQFVQTISEIAVVSTERRVTDGARVIEGGIKERTTVAMDFGRARLLDDRVLHLYGTPGQKRFDFMWAALARGMKGLVILVDSTSPATFRAAREIVDFFEIHHTTPYVVVANKQDLGGAWAPEELRLALRLPPEVKVLPCVATDRASVQGVLDELLVAMRTAVNLA
jgi:signal recognition particle receptor subunit beta/pimeloyl-ACP methyl ester carboxylesterase